MNNLRKTKRIFIMNKTLAVCLATLIGSVSIGAIAQETAFEERVNSAKHSDFSYQWLELDYVSLGDGYAGNEKTDGLRLDLSVPVADQFSVIGGLSYYSSKFVDTTWLSVGASYHLNIGTLSTVSELKKMDGVIHAEIEYVDLDCDGFKCDSELGILTGLEARYWVLESLEVYADLSLRTTVDTDIIFSSGVRFSVIEELQLTAGFSLADVDEITLGARYNF